MIQINKNSINWDSNQWPVFWNSFVSLTRLRRYHVNKKTFSLFCWKVKFSVGVSLWPGEKKWKRKLAVRVGLFLLKVLTIKRYFSFPLKSWRLKNIRRYFWTIISFRRFYRIPAKLTGLSFNFQSTKFVKLPTFVKKWRIFMKLPKHI